ncbi:hypothetical protein BDY19DRAFT_1070111 [Irpex rosettiformis]|uniref:Uncharacterized protein n=1 Tax=Irpex rosettiformis TaxID=378272 RepID=A0ACB8U530_9APHY|nr:hypothetical protein BDY19DRAFT_1070111 [Irpex rosettiformis]
MSEVDTEEAVGPRRSQRERRQTSLFESTDSQQSKRKRSEEDDDELSELTESDNPDANNDDADVEEDYSAPKSKPKLKAKGSLPKPAPAPGAQPKRRGRPPGKKPRMTITKVPGPPKLRKQRARKGGAGFDAEQVAKETKITNDNPLFNAIMNPSAVLQSTVEDFLDSLTQTPAPAQGELTNCVLRACGCNHTIDGDEAVDYDGIVDALDNITEALKQDDTPVYPLTSKLHAFRPFRASLTEFLSRLISSAADMGHLYSTDLMTTLQAWVVAMSSSQLRSFRHTASVVALEVETALCEVAAAVEKEAEVVSRQKEGERKRKKGKAEPTTAREKELDGKAAEIRERRAKLAEFLKEFVDGVFVHRYRDLDPNIRSECVRAMGLWFSKYPAHFLDGQYLRYVGWVLSDSNTHVRLEAVKALSLAYVQTEFIGIGALQHFTERFKPRLVEMAMSDTELTVRVAVVQVLQAIDSHGLLEDDQRSKLCLLIFDEEPKMRKAVSAFVKGVWEESLEERLVGKKPDSKDKKRAGIKALAMLLVQWGKALDKGKSVEEDDDMEEDGEQSEGSRRGRTKDVMGVIGPDQKGRTALAVDALWDEVPQIGDWESLLDLLQLDHSASEGQSSQSRTKKKGRQTASESTVDEVWRLEEVEEGVLLEVLAAALRKTKAIATATKKGEEDIVSSDITRALMKALPRLFVKYQTDPGRMSDVLQLPQLMNLDMYLEMRMMTAYSSLWDDVVKQFTSHSAPIILSTAVVTIRCMMDATSLSNTNSTKILELEELLSTSLRDVIQGRDELEIASFSEDEVLALTSICTRLSTLAGTRDMTSWMEEDEGGKQSSAWDIIMALVERGKLGYKEEESMIDQALHLQTLYIIWKARGLTAAPDPSHEEIRYRDRLKECRDALTEKLLEFTIGTQSNTTDAVRRAAFQNLMNLHILFCPAQSIAPDGSELPTAKLALTLDDETQYRCAGFVQAEIERYAEELAERKSDSVESDEQDSEREQSEEEGETKAIRSKKSKGKQPIVDIPGNDSARSQLEKEYAFMGLIATFLRAIRAGAIHFRHCSVLLAHYGRLGTSFDLCAKLIVDILREEGMYQENGDVVVAVITQALRESFLMVLDGISPTEENSVALSKLLSTAFLIRGAQLSIVKRLDSQFVVSIHTSLISWLFKRIAAYDAAGNKKARTKCITFFKVLTPLVNSIDNRNSLRIKAHLDQILAQSKVEVVATSKVWDAYRAYEKKLTTAKEKVVNGRAKKGKAVKSAEAITTEDEGMMTDASAAPRSKGVYRDAAVHSGMEDNESGRDSPPRAPEPQTPRQRPRPKPVVRQRTPDQTSPEPSRSPSPVQSEPSAKGSSPPLSEPPLTPEPDEPEEDVATPTASRKRQHSPDGDESVQGSVAGDDGSPSEIPDSQDDRIHIRRKRVRH